MKKPKKPSNKLEMQGNTSFYFDHVSNKVALSYFIDWTKKSLPKGAKDVTLSLEEDYDDEGNSISCYITLSWKYRIKNTRYASEMKKYQSKMKKWEKTCQK